MTASLRSFFKVQTGYKTKTDKSDANTQVSMMMGQEDRMEAGSGITKMVSTQEAS